MVTESQLLFKKVTFKAADLFPFPTTVTQLLKLSREPNVTSRDICTIIERDQAMASQILRLANSVSFGFSQRVRTISHAIVCLGFNKVKGLALTVSAHSMINDAMQKFDLKMGVLFNHSLAVAIGARLIAEKNKLQDPEEVYLMGLLHDVGKMIMNKNDLVQLEPVWDLYKKGEMTFSRAEKTILGFDHADVGSEVARGWNFPGELCTAIGYHHTPFSLVGDSKNALIIYLANGLAKTIPMASGLSDQQRVSLETGGVFREENLKTLNLSSDDVLNIRAQVETTLEDLLKELNTSKQA